MDVSARSRLGKNAQRLGLGSVSDHYVSGLVSVSAENVSSSRSRDISSRRSRRFVLPAHSAAQCSRRRPIQTYLP